MGGRNAAVLTILIMLIINSNTVTYVTKTQAKPFSHILVLHGINPSVDKKKGCLRTPYKGEYFVAREEGCLPTLYIQHVTYQLL